MRAEGAPLKIRGATPRAAAAFDTLKPQRR
jgi:hypothetical protein